jgi:hypothetical protein
MPAENTQLGMRVLNKKNPGRFLQERHDESIVKLWLKMFCRF